MAALGPVNAATVPRKVIRESLADLGEHRGTAVTPEAVELVRELYRAASDASSSQHHAMEVLEEQLADADRRSRRSNIQGDVLGDALLERTNRIHDLEVRFSQPESDWKGQSGAAPTSSLAPIPTPRSCLRNGTSCSNRSRASVKSSKPRARNGPPPKHAASF